MLGKRTFFQQGSQYQSIEALNIECLGSCIRKKRLVEVILLDYTTWHFAAVVVVVVIGPLAKVSLRYVRFSVDIATPSKISQVCFL